MLSLFILEKLPILLMVAIQCNKRGTTLACIIFLMMSSYFFLLFFKKITGCLALICKEDFYVQVGQCPNRGDTTGDFLDRPCYVCVVEKQSRICTYYCYQENFCKTIVGPDCEAAPNCFNDNGEYKCACFGDYCNDIACLESQGHVSSVFGACKC